MKHPMAILGFKSMLTLLAIVLSIGGRVQARETGTAADVVPADCAYFTTSPNFGKQIDSILHSRAFAQIRNLPAYEQIWNLPEVQKEWTRIQNRDEFQQAQAMFESPAAQRIIAAVKDALSEELFHYGGKEWIDFFKMYQDYYQQSILAGIGAGITGKEPKPLLFLVTTLLNRPDFKLPPLVTGFKVSNPDGINDLLDQLQTLVNEAAAGVQIEKKNIAGNEFYSLTLSVEMLEIDREDFVQDLDQEGVGRGLADAFYDWLQQRTLTVSLGHHRGYFLISIAGDNDHLERFSTQPTLAEAKSFAPAHRHVHEGLVVDVTYQSRALQALSTLDPKALQQGAAAASALVQAFLPPELSGRLSADIRKLAGDLSSVLPEPSAIVSVTLQDRGFETFVYSRSIPRSTDYNRPLSILRHAGPRPLFAAAISEKSSKQAYATAVEWAKTAYGYWIDFGVDRLEEGDRALYREIEELALPFFASLDQTTRTKFVPALDAAQTMIVLDTKMRVSNLSPAVLFTETMPMLELGLAVTLNDEKLFLEAMDDYVAAVNELIPKIQALTGFAGQPFRLPSPQTKSHGPSGTMYFYPIPPVVDEAILPHAVIGKNLLILSWSPGQSMRMLENELAPNGGPVALDKASGSATFADTSVLFSALREWVEYAMQQPGGPLDNPDPAMEKMIRENGDIIWRVIGCFKGCASRSYVEDGYVVNHSWSQFEDLTE